MKISTEHVNAITLGYFHFLSHHNNDEVLFNMFVGELWENHFCTQLPKEINKNNINQIESLQLNIRYLGISSHVIRKSLILKLT